jgi:hypothetical protein
VSVSPSLMLLGIGSMKTFPRQRIHTQQQKNSCTSNFMCFPSHRLFVLPGASNLLSAKFIKIFQILWYAENYNQSSFAIQIFRNILYIYSATSRFLSPRHRDTLPALRKLRHYGNNWNTSTPTTTKTKPLLNSLTRIIVSVLRFLCRIKLGVRVAQSV